MESTANAIAGNRATSTCNARDCVKTRPFEYRSLPCTNAINANFDGFCWKGIDYWTYTTAEGTDRCPLNTYVRFGNIVGSTPRTIAAPGPDGAVATVQYEMLREGIQDCEAIFYIRRLLRDSKRRDAVGDEVATRAETAIEDILCLLETGLRYSPQGGGDLRRYSTRLHTAAAEITSRLRLRNDQPAAAP